MTLGEPWNRWERRPAFTTKHGAQVHPLYTLGANGDRYNGGTIYVYDAEVALEDADYPPGLKHRVGWMTWNADVIVYVEVAEPWKRQGIATEIFRLAQEVAPNLRHAEQRTPEAEKWIATVSPGEAAPTEPEAPAPTEPRSPSWLSRLVGLFSRSR